MDKDFLLSITAAGHEPIQERDTFRHKTYRKDFAPGTKVTRDGLPLIARGSAKRDTLTTDMILPERADLALDPEGAVVSQDEFQRRYREHRRWFPMVEGSDPTCEPVPGVIDFLMAVPDRWTESPGYVEAGFDPYIPAPEKTHTYDPIQDKLIPIMENQNTMGEAIKVLLQQATEKRGPGRPPMDRSAA